MFVRTQLSGCYRALRARAQAATGGIIREGYGLVVLTLAIKKSLQLKRFPRLCKIEEGHSVEKFHDCAPE